MMIRIFKKLITRKYKKQAFFEKNLLKLSEKTIAKKFHFTNFIKFIKNIKNYSSIER